MSSAPASRSRADPAASDRIEPHVWKIAGVVILGMIMSILDTTIVNVALHTLGHDLHSTISQIQWVITGYLLSLAAVIPLTGWAARRYGAKRVYMTSLVLFTVGSALCAVAASTTALVLFRVLQGAGGGMIMPVGQLIMAQVAGSQADGPRDGDRGDAGDARADPRTGPRRSDPAVPALVVDLPRERPDRRGRVHPRLAHAAPHRLRARPGAWTWSAWRCSRRPRAPSSTASASSAPTAASPPRGSCGRSSAGVVLAGVFCWHALRVERPLLDVRLYANRVFGAASLTTFGLGAALFGAMILVPLYYQEVRHESVILTGLLTGPQGIGMLLVMPLAGRLSDRFGGGRVALAGVSILCVATVPLAFIGTDTSILYISLVLVLRGVGIGFSFMPAMTAAFASLRHDQLSDATPQLNVLQRIGGAIGTAVLAVVLQRASGHRPVAGQARRRPTAPPSGGRWASHCCP